MFHKPATQLLLAMLALNVASGFRVRLQAENSTVVSPMEISPHLEASGGFLVQSDPANCGNKDPSGKQLTVAAPRGYVTFSFHLESPMVVSIEANILTPDSLSDSFWARLNDLNKLKWFTARRKQLGMDVFSPFSLTNSNLPQQCFALPSGTNTLSLFIREPGAAVDFIEVITPHPIELEGPMEGCSGGCTEGAVARFKLNNLCGPDTTDLLAITIDGIPCTNVQYESTDTITCVAPYLDGDSPEREVVIQQAGHEARGVISYQVRASNRSPTASAWLSTYWYVVVIIVVVLVAGILAIGYLMFTRHVLLSETRSPPEGLVALVSTDIQDSTAIWESTPGVMKEALQVHDAVVRALIIQNNGYEVKTEGDSFLVAFDTVTEAATFCVKLQFDLLQADWPTALLEIPQCAPKHPEWRGLKVRMGIHIGEPTMQRNATTRRMDYFGPAVNRASMVEGLGHGGMILLSNEARVALNEELGDVAFQNQVKVLQQVNSATKHAVHPVTEQASAGNEEDDRESSHIAMCREFTVEGQYVEQIFVGQYFLKGINRPQKIHMLIPAKLSTRIFPPLKGEAVTLRRSSVSTKG